MPQFTSETAAEAGRKSKRGATERVKILNQFFEDNKETVKAILLDVQTKAAAGDMEAQKLYLAYCFGKPEAKMDVTSDGEQILGFNYFPSEKPQPYQTKGTNGLQTKSGIV
jgi:hypothetical protein